MAAIELWFKLSLVTVILYFEFVSQSRQTTIYAGQGTEKIFSNGKNNPICTYVVISDATESTMKISWNRTLCGNQIRFININPISHEEEIELCVRIKCQNTQKTVNVTAGTSEVLIADLCPGNPYQIRTYLKDGNSLIDYGETLKGRLPTVKNLRVALITGTGDSNRNLSLRWTNPSCTKDLNKIKSSVYYKEKSAGDFKVIFPSPLYNEHVLVPNLKPWTVHVFKVQFCVVPPKYLEPCSESDTIEAKEKAAIPMKPKDVRISAQTKSELIVQWTPAEPQTGPTYYMLRLDQAQPDIMTVCDALGLLTWTERVKTAILDGWHQNRFIFDDLKLNHCYRVMVISQTEAGSTFSDYSNIILVK